MEDAENDIRETKIEQKVTGKENYTEEWSKGGQGS
jgi:hypothetical protein